MKRYEKFNSTDIPNGFYWFNQPKHFKTGNGLEIYTDTKTDFWQKTNYGFMRDDGHCLFTKITGDFTAMTHVEFDPKEKYDQCGILARVNEQNWIKASTEFEDSKISRLGSVVTNLGYSDWATNDISSSYNKMWYKINRRSNDFRIESSFDGTKWNQMRITHLHSASEQIEIGMYACSPIGRNFHCRFFVFSIGENNWFNEEN
ncbi:MAG TPA: DUF1349 domain-containing protein [Victivallales bacterium]|nr:DUF1349 domain-containing protein [Victivallales bacterium]